jgi:AraC-like DNA-binding protein
LFAPPFADAHVSLAFSFEQGYARGSEWRRALPAPHAEIIGPMSTAGAPPVGWCPESVGVFLRAGSARALFGAPAAELGDRAVSLKDLWGGAAAGLPEELAEAGEALRIDRLEALLLRRLSPQAASPLDVPGLVRAIVRTRGRIRIDQLAADAGVSRQHLTRSFRESVGVSPKLFARLARFRAGLAFAVRGAADWAQAAIELGYADQSHMIAEFREFCGLTPDSLARQPWFHPFLERARKR